MLLTVKSHQTAAALDDLGAHAPAGTVVVCAQNGVANEAAVLRRFARTYAVCVMLPALHLEPGVVVQKRHPTPGILDVGRFPTGPTRTAEAIAADLRPAGLRVPAAPDIMAWKHRKLLTNLGNVVDASFAAGQAADELAARARRRASAVLAAAGIRGHRRGGRRASWRPARQRADVAAYRGQLARAEPGPRASTEIHYRVGELVLLGRLHGVPTPGLRTRAPPRRPLPPGDAPSLDGAGTGLLPAAGCQAAHHDDPTPRRAG